MTTFPASPAPASGTPLRILQLNSMLTGGGTDDQCVKLAAGLRALGHTVWLAGPDGREASLVARRLGIPFHATPPEGPAKVRFILSAARFVRRERVHIVHGHHGRDLWPTVLAARLAGTRPRIVLTRHLAKSPSSWVSRRFLLGQCDALIAVSRFVARVLAEGVYEPDSPEPERRSRPPLHGDHSKIRVIHGGIDTDRFRPTDSPAMRAEWGLAPGHFAFAVVGAYQHPRGKGQREFLAAAARIHTQVPQARFLLIGRGNMAEVLRGDIERLGLRGKASLTPYCTDMPSAMNAIDCLVHPAGGTEAFPGVVLEASACGRPVIASTLDGVPEAFAVGGVGELVGNSDPESLATAMQRLARQPALGESERNALHEAVAARCSVRTLGETVARLYAELVDDRRPGGTL